MNRVKADILFALLIICFGVYVAWTGFELSIGTLRRIGPGFFPALLGTIMALLGIGIVLAVRERSDPGPFNLRGLFFVALAIFAFAVLTEGAGLVPAIAALVLLVGAGSPDRPSKVMTASLIVGISAVGYLLFDWALGLPLRPFGDAFGFL